jgi:hypothetical protein
VATAPESSPGPGGRRGGTATVLLIEGVPVRFRLREGSWRRRGARGHAGVERGGRVRRRDAEVTLGALCVQRQGKTEEGGNGGARPRVRRGLGFLRGDSALL